LESDRWVFASFGGLRQLLCGGNIEAVWVSVGAAGFQAGAFGGTVESQGTGADIRLLNERFFP
jgi:hypothetical protein